MLNMVKTKNKSFNRLKQESFEDLFAFDFFFKKII